MSAERQDKVRYLPLLCDELTEELTLKASTELNETQEKVQQGLHALKSFIAEENLQVCTDDLFLLAFLRLRKFQIDKAQDSLRRYATMRIKYMKYLAYIDFSVIKKFFDWKMCGFLPYRDEDGAAILYLREIVIPPGRINVDEAVNCFFSLLHFLLEYPASTISGCKMILDFPMNRFSNYYAYVRAALLYFHALVPTLPIRMKRADVVNENRFSRAIINIVWPFIPKKLANRVYIHGNNMKSLEKFYPPSILPEEFGGTIGPIENEFFLKEFRIFYEKMRSQNTLLQNRNSIPKGPFKSSHGIFKKESEKPHSSGRRNSIIEFFKKSEASHRSVLSARRSSFDFFKREARDSTAPTERRKSAFVLFKNKVRNDSIDSSGNRESSLEISTDQADISTADIPSGNRRNSFGLFRKKAQHSEYGMSNTSSIHSSHEVHVLKANIRCERRFDIRCGLFKNRVKTSQNSGRRKLAFGFLRKKSQA